MNLEINKTVSKGKTYNNVKLNKIGFGEKITVKIIFKTAKEFDSKFQSDNGEVKKTYGYTVNLIEPKIDGIDEISFFAKPSLHRQLSAFQPGDIVTIATKEMWAKIQQKDGTTREQSYKGYVVEKVKLVLSDDDVKKIVETLKEGGAVDEKVIREVLRLEGYDEESDVQRILASLKESPQ